MSTDSIYITRWGQSGPRVVMVHGSAQGSKVGGDRHFSAQESLGAEGLQVIVPDRPGHGRSASPGRPDDAEVDGEWVAEILGDGAHLVGHSFGGCVALAAAAKRPEAVLSLTLIEPGMQKLAMDDPAVRKFGLKMLMVVFLSISAEARAARFAKLVRIPAEIRGGSDRQELAEMGQAIARLKIPSRETLERELTIVRLSAIPLLTITGGWSLAFDATGRRVASIGGGKHMLIKSEHHFPHLVFDEFNRVFLSFVRDRVLRSIEN